MASDDFHYDCSHYKVWASMKGISFTIAIPYVKENSFEEVCAVHDAIWEHLFNKVELDTAHGKKKISTPTGELLRNMAVALAIDQKISMGMAVAELKLKILQNMKWERLTIHRQA